MTAGQHGAASRHEIACDESGSEGNRLVGGNTAVFAHAGVRLSIETAAACIAEIRDRVRSPAVEYKANHLLRERHRAVLMWFLGPTAPILGNAHVYLVEKAYLVVDRLVATLAGRPDVAADAEIRGVATAVYRSGPAVLGAAGWQSFLAAANDVLREQEIDIDPLAPAVRRAIARWSTDTLPVTIVHDRQNGLTDDKVASMRRLSGLTDLRFRASSADPRIQIADFVAGVARKIAEDALQGRGDPSLTALLRPYVDPASVWADQGSWSMLDPAGSTGSGPTVGSGAAAS